jgi:hypothetical protein
VRAAAVTTLPVFGVPVGSMSNRWASSSATVRCSTPLGTTYISPAFEYQEEIVGVRMRMPNELAFDFDDHEIVVIECADCSWAPVLVESFELF